MDDVSPSTKHETNASWQGKRLFRGAWWWGSVAGTFFATFFPYWLWNIRMEGWGWKAFVRFPVSPNPVFDTYLYFQQMSLLKAGIDTGTFAWFSWPLRALMGIIPQASIPEIWLMTRWITAFLLLWVGAWCIRRFSGASQGVSRWLIVCYWFTFLLAIGLRPGAFSWYQPIGYLGFGLLALAVDAGRKHAWLRSFFFSFVALGLLYVYPWFFIYGLFILATCIAAKMILTHRSWCFALLAAAAIVSCVYGVLLASGAIIFHVPAVFAEYDRNGISLSHAPLISNTVVAMLAWIGLLLSVQRRRAGQDQTLMAVTWSWIVLFMVWFSPLFLGVEFLNDHFILIVAMLSWTTLAFFATTTPSVPTVETSVGTRRISMGIALFASAFFFYVLQQALRHIGKFEPYGIHLSIWLALAAAAWFAWMNMRGMTIESIWLRARIPLMVISMIIGTLGLFAVIQRCMAQMPDLAVRAPVIGWIQTHVPEHDAVCTDPVSARIYGAHDARLTYPNESNLMFKESDDILQRRFETIIVAYDSSAAGVEGMFPFLINGVRASACDQFAKVARVLRWFGWSKEQADSFIGCQEQLASAYVKKVMDVINAHEVDATAFRATCPWVIIPDDQRAYWHLPASYEETRVDSRTSAWHVK
jgi:hypothetical protein